MGRAARTGGDRLPLPSGRGRQPGPHRARVRTALARSDGVVVCGGLGPTHDDITRDAIAEVMAVPLVRDTEIVKRIAEMFSSRGRRHAREQRSPGRRARRRHPDPPAAGHRPRLICPVGHKVVYALPGVPYELTEMFTRAVLPDLHAAELAGEAAAIVSRTVRTWGMSESGLAELLAPRIEALDAAGATPPSPSSPVGSKASRSTSPPRRPTRRRRSPSSTPRRRKYAPWWARSSSASTTRPWRRPSPHWCGTAP